MFLKILKRKLQKNENRFKQKALVYCNRDKVQQQQSKRIIEEKEIEKRLENCCKKNSKKVLVKLFSEIISLDT